MASATRIRNGLGIRLIDMISSCLQRLLLGCLALLLSACAAGSALTGRTHASASTRTAATAASCSATLAAQLQDANATKVAADFPPSQVPPAELQPLTQTAAEQLGREFGGQFGNGPAPADAAVSAIELAYGVWADQDGTPRNPLINPNRCVWVVKVQSPFTSHAPYGVTPKTYLSYTAIIDEGSHRLIGIAAP